MSLQLFMKPSLLFTNPQSSNIVYSAMGGRGIFLTNLNVRMLMIDPSSPSTIYAGTSDGGEFAMTLN